MTQTSEKTLLGIITMNVSLKIALSIILIFNLLTITNANLKLAEDRLKCKNEIKSSDLTKSLNVNGQSEARVGQLRNLLRSQNLDAYVIPAKDQHLSEFVGDHDKRREWISGFTGSAGIAIITLNESVLWTDARYLLQADAELDCDWSILEIEPEIWQWLGVNLKSGAKIGVNPKLFSKIELEKAEAEIKKDIEVIRVKEDLVDAMWTENRSPRPNGRNIEVWGMKNAGVSWEEKSMLLRQKMAEVDVDFLVITNLMEVAWVLNLRGDDVSFNPVFYSFLILPRRKEDAILLYVNKNRITDQVQKHLIPNCQLKFDYYIKNRTEVDKFCPSKSVEIKAYDTFYDDLDSLAKNEKNKFWFSSGTNFKVFQIIRKPEQRITEVEPPIMIAKARKNPTETQGMKNAHIRDAVAVIELMAELEKKIETQEWNEQDVAIQLKALRIAQGARGESFPTVSGYEENGAIIHYNPMTNKHPKLIGKGMLLLDSGGQYVDGTTDVTRTFHFGEPTDFQKESYTRVLMGHVDLAMVTFPADEVTGKEMQMFARGPMWQKGMEYPHGTGHGIGAFLSCHEPPGLNPASSKDGIREGMFFSDEPGYYVTGKFGIRIENICFAKQVQLEFAKKEKKFLGIECVTLVPYETKLLNLPSLSLRQREWINEYHSQCAAVIGPELQRQNKLAAYDWLMSRTSPLPLLVESNGAQIFTVSQLMVFVIVVYLSVVVL